MAQPDFSAIGNHIEDIQNGFQGIRNQVDLVPNMPAVVGYNELRQETNELRQRMEENQTGIRDILGRMENEYLYWPPFGKWGQLTGQLGSNGLGTELCDFRMSIFTDLRLASEHNWLVN